MTSNPDLARRFEAVLHRIKTAAESAQRDPAQVRLLAISKLHPLEKIEAVHALGQRAFGENYVQEAVEKTDADRAPDLEWHFVGRIQTNKVKLIANRFAYIHSIERFEVAERLNAATTATQKIFVQFNVGGEESKAGAGADDVGGLIERIARECPKLCVVGLMVMPPLNDDPEATRPFFKSARDVLVRAKARVPGASARPTLDGHQRGLRGRDSGGGDLDPGGDRSLRPKAREDLAGTPPKRRRRAGPRPRDAAHSEHERKHRFHRCRQHVSGAHRGLAPGQRVHARRNLRQQPHRGEAEAGGRSIQHQRLRHQRRGGRQIRRGRHRGQAAGLRRRDRAHRLELSRGPDRGQPGGRRAAA